jgi:hypothetical protein
VLRDKAAELTRQCGRDVVVTAVSARDPKRDRGVDLGSLRHLDRIVEPFGGTEIDAAITLGIAGRNGSHDDVAAALARQFGSLVAQHARHRGTDSAKTRNSNTQRFSHVRRRPSNSAQLRCAATLEQFQEKCEAVFRPELRQKQ